MDEEFGEWKEQDPSDILMSLAWKAVTRINKEIDNDRPSTNKRLVPLKILTAGCREGNGQNYECDVLMGETVQEFCVLDAHKIGITEPYDLDENGEQSIWRLRAWIEPAQTRAAGRPTIQWVDKLRDVKKTRNKSYLPYSNYNRRNESQNHERRHSSSSTVLVPEGERNFLPSNDYMGENEPENYRQEKNFKFCQFVVQDPKKPNDLDIRSVGPNMELQQKPNGQRMLYSAEFWLWMHQCRLTKFEKMRDVSSTEKL